jgi:hypothetical protein
MAGEPCRIGMQQRVPLATAPAAFNRALGQAFASAWTTFAVFPIGPLLSEQLHGHSSNRDS